MRPFDHPVPIVYLDEAAYTEAVTGDVNDLTDEDRQDIQVAEGELKALGLIGGDVDLLESQLQLVGEGTLAFYDQDTDKITVLGTGPLDVAHRVTLVHELTHAWQDQQTDLSRMDDMESPESSTFQAVVEGDATHVEDQYVESLSSAEQDAYYSQAADASGEVDLAGVPDSLVAFFAAPYALGGPFAAVLDANGGNTELDLALEIPPPADADLIDPTRYIQGVEPIDVEEPSVPDGAERIDGGDFGAVSWFFTLAERIDPRQALAVVDGWGGDNSVTYRQDDRICIAAAYQGTSPTATAEATTALDSWVAGSPGLQATTETVGQAVVLRSCEPANGEPVAAPAGQSRVSLQYPALRLTLVAQVLDEGAPLDQAVCFGNHIVDNLTPDEMASQDSMSSDEVTRRGTEASLACFN